jgi:hypothetical protein
VERLRRALRGDDLPIGEAMHPIALAAVIVLVVNDWVLKPRFAGALTGKLSDVAGLVFAPVVLSAAIGLVRRARITRFRLIACIAATGVGFAVLKLLPHGVALGPLRAVADPTDLFCLPALAIAWWIGADELRRVTESAHADR